MEWRFFSLDFFFVKCILQTLFRVKRLKNRPIYPLLKKEEFRQRIRKSFLRLPHRCKCVYNVSKPKYLVATTCLFEFWLRIWETWEKLYCNEIRNLHSILYLCVAGIKDDGSRLFFSPRISRIFSHLVIIRYAADALKISNDITGRGQTRAWPMFAWVHTRDIDLKTSWPGRGPMKRE